MKIRVSIIVLGLVLAYGESYCQQAVLVSKGLVKGYVFPIEHVALIGNLSKEYRFEPKLSDLKKFERRLKEEVALLTEGYRYKDKECPCIEKKLKKYVRQYFGFINEDGNEVIYVNFVWHKSEGIVKQKIHTSVIQVYGGCSKYWSIKFNITDSIFYDLYINEAD